MIITRHGGAFFKLQLGDLTVAVNPPSKSSKSKASRFGSDIVLQNINQEDFNGGEEMNLGGKTPFVITGPGEYEIKNIFVRGLPGETMYGDKKSTNTIYTLTMDGINICILGFLSTKTLSVEAKAGITDVDLLFIGFGNGALSPSDSYKLAVSMEPKAIIPYSMNESDLKAFLKEGGSTAKGEDKQTLKRKDLEGKDGDILLLNIT